MLRLFICVYLAAGLLWAKNPYRVAVCGSARNAEELEMALELNPKFLVRSCGDKNLDATLEITTRSVEAYSDKEDFFEEKRERAILSEKKAKQLVERLFKCLSEPKPKTKTEEPKDLTPSPSPATGEGSIGIVEIIDNFLIPSSPSPLGGEGLGVRWQIESSASMDQWTSSLSSRLYPGVSLRGQYRFLEGWGLEGRFAFGTSAFRVGDQVAWNQQILSSFTGEKIFDLGAGFGLGPTTGYFFWGSLAEASELPKFQKHDAWLGVRVSYTLERPRLEVDLGFAFLPVNLGLRSSTGVRFYFVQNWYAVVEGQWLNLWASEKESSFLSASLGLGFAL